MKRLLSLGMIILLLAGILKVSAVTFKVAVPNKTLTKDTVVNMDFSVFDNTTTVMVGSDDPRALRNNNYCSIANTTTGTVTVPDTITYNGTKYAVVKLGQAAFNGCTALTGVIINAPVTEVGQWAFRGCSSLQSIAIPDSVVSIHKSAFLGCTSLGSVTFGNNSRLETIEAGCFNNCSSLSSITLPSTVNQIDGAFSNCTGLVSINLPSDIESIGTSTFDGCTHLENVYFQDKVNFIGSYAFHDCKSLKTISIPSGVTTINEGVFDSCTVLTNIVLPEGVATIDKYAFRGCEALSSIHIPDGVTTIADGVFNGCIRLNAVNIPAHVNAIGNYSFAKTLLDTVKLPETVTSLGYNAFDNCIQLKSINIPDAVTSIGIDAFHNCSVLDSIHVPAGVTELGESTFDGCKQLRKVNIPDQVASIGNYVFRDCESLDSIHIPDGITTLNSGTFDGCTKLKKVNIPDVMTTIGADAFRNCAAMDSIFFPESVTAIGTDAFSGCSGLLSGKILFPVSLLGQVSVQGDLINASDSKTYLKIEHALSTYNIPVNMDISQVSTLNADNQEEDNSDLKTYICKTYDKTNKTISEDVVSGILPANTGVLFSGTVGTRYAIPVKVSATTLADVSGNKLIGVSSDTEIGVSSSAYTDYVLVDGIFYKSNLGFLPASRAYLHLEWNISSSAKMLKVVDDAATTSIRNISTETDANDAPLYNLEGKRVDRNYRGIVIRNGNKILNR
jgi:hypothetical protein